MFVINNLIANIIHIEFLASPGDKIIGLIIHGDAIIGQNCIDYKIS